MRSRDGGKTWKPVPLPGETVYRLSYLPAVGRIVALTGSGAFQTSDLGSTWKRTGDGIAASRVRSLAAAGNGGRILMAGLEACPSGIARSSDGGKTWKLQEIRKPGVHYGSGVSIDIEALASAPSRPLRVYAAGMDEVLRSDDGGITWTHFGFNDGISGGHAASIAVHPTNPNLVFVAGQHGLSRSSNGGRTWSGGLHEHPYNDMTAVVFEPGRPERMLAASANGGLVRSVDTGASWEPVPGTEFLVVGMLAFDPRDPNVVLASSLFDDARIYRSTDGGSTWAPSDIGIEGTIRGLTFSAEWRESGRRGGRGCLPQQRRWADLAACRRRAGRGAGDPAAEERDSARGHRRRGGLQPGRLFGTVVGVDLFVVYSPGCICGMELSVDSGPHEQPGGNQ